MTLTVVPLSERPELQKEFNDPLLNSAWPAFMLDDDPGDAGAGFCLAGAAVHRLCRA